MKKTSALLLTALLLTTLLTGCLPGLNSTVELPCITSVTMTDTESGKTTELKLDFDVNTGVLTAVSPKGRIEYTFDRNGELLSRYWYYPDGTVRDSIVRTFVDGRLIKTESYHNDNISVPSTSTTEYIYGKSGKLEKTVGYHGDWLASEVSYRKDGSVSQQIDYIYGFGEGAMNIYTYAADGRILSQQNMRNGYEDSSVEYVYDKKGVLQQKISYKNKRAGMKSTATMHYDSEGNRVEYSIVDYQGDTRWYRYTYDEKGNMLTRDYSEDDDGCGYVWTYDEESRVISQRAGSGATMYWTYNDKGQIATHRMSNTSIDYSYTYTTLQLSVPLANAVYEATDSLLHLFITYPIDYEWDP